MSEFEPTHHSQRAESSVPLYQITDGPGTDGTLGRILNERPTATTRPDWSRLVPYLRREFADGEIQITFVMWGPGSAPFMSVLEQLDFRLSVVDRMAEPDGIVGRISAEIERIEATHGPNEPYDLVVATHQPRLINALPHLAPSARRIILLGFDEWLPGDDELDQRIEVFDLETDARMFRIRLPRDQHDDGPERPQAAAFKSPSAQAQQLLFSSAERRTISPLRTDLLKTSSVEPWQQELAAAAMPEPAAAEPALAGRSELQEGPLREFYFLTDGRSIEQALGEIMGEKPQAESRPRWERVMQFAQRQARTGGEPVRAVFFHIAPGHAGFTRALIHLGYKTMPVSQDGFNPGRSVVEEAVCRVLQSSTLVGAEDSSAPDVMVISHSDKVFELLEQLPDDGQRLMALGFPEHMPVGEYDRIERFDIEHDAQAFLSPLPRMRGIDVDAFDPDEELERLF